MEFKPFGVAVAAQFQEMTKTGLYRANVSKDVMWEAYINSFPEGSNPLYKERTEHDCQCCKSFIRAVGNVVSIVNGEVITIWDIKVDGFYQVVADAMAELIKTSKIQNLFLTTEAKVGTASNRQMDEVVGGGESKVIVWHHFFANIPSQFVKPGLEIGPLQSESRSTFDVFLRALNEITVDSCETVIEIMQQGSLYRSAEFKPTVEQFLKKKLEFSKLKNEIERELFVWSSLATTPMYISRVRSSVIGTLLVDLSSGVELEDAVKMFEYKVAPASYKRPTALVSKAMIEKAKQTINELGLATALDRRYATLEDIKINNVLFADNTARGQMKDVFDILSSKVPEKEQKLDKIEEVSINDFINNIVPKAESIEVFFENRHSNNLVSLIAPSDPTALELFKWPNKFSWSYTGEFADSIKERVKAAGGSVTGELRCSLSWHNYDDLDLHMRQPKGYSEIYFGSKKCGRTQGQLDVDMNAAGGHSKTPVENITFPSKSKMAEGEYVLVVNQWNRRESNDIGFEVEIEFDGVIHSFSHTGAMPSGKNVEVARIQYSHKTGIKLIPILQSSQTTKTIWNIGTQTWQKVNVLMYSPNFWDDFKTGNKHYFFMLDHCLNDGQARGFYNEFLKPELNEHRKVLEMVGAKMKTDLADRQLSGLGFSIDQRNNLLCRVKGKFTRQINLKF